jgi:TRAP-type C4-dicarboxylate transport system permease small subunit
MSEISSHAENKKHHPVKFSELSFEEIISSIALICIVLSVTWGVITRYLLAQPAAWTGEVATILFAWMVFIGSAAVFKKSEHIAIDVLLVCMPPRLHHLIQTLVDICVFIVLITMSVLATEFSISAIDVPTTILRIPETTIYGGVAAGFILMSIRHAIAAVRRIRLQGASK